VSRKRPGHRLCGGAYWCIAVLPATQYSTSSAPYAVFSLSVLGINRIGGREPEEHHDCEPSNTLHQPIVIAQARPAVQNHFSEYVSCGV